MSHAARRVGWITLAFLLLLYGCADQGTKGPNTQTAAPQVIRTPGATVTYPSSQGSQQILSGLRFTGSIGERGLVASGVRLGRVAGCALPAGLNNAAVPVFLLSDDAGFTWRSYAISGAHASTSCTLLADTHQPDLFALGQNSGGSILVTTDGGQSWRAIIAPCGGSIVLVALVDGQLVAHMCGAGPSEPARDGQISIASNSIGNWQPVTTIPPAVAQHSATYSLQAVAVDPDNVKRSYAVVSTGSFDVALYATADSGQSWKIVREWPTAKSLALWVATGGQVFVQDLFDREATSAQFFYSADGGITWRDIGLHSREEGGEQMFVGARGRVVSYVGTSTPNGSVFSLFELNPNSGAFSLLGHPTFGGGVHIGVVAEGDHPTLLYVGQSDTYLLSLPPR